MRQATSCQTLYCHRCRKAELLGWWPMPGCRPCGLSLLAEKVFVGRHRTLDIDGESVYIPQSHCGRSSVVERHVANVNVVSSNLITRFKCLAHKGLGVVLR